MTGGFKCISVALGKDTRNTCNPGVGDVDGDGLDELAVPVIEGDRCRISLYKGDGREVWRNDDVRFFNFFYGDMEAYAGSHWHARSYHRHLFTRIFDIDGDGRPEVVCADGPVYILDALTGATKRVIDLDAHVQTWCPARLAGADAPPSFVGGIEKRDGSGSFIVAIGADLDVEWMVPVEGRCFTDAIWAGDVDGDGCDEIVFSPDTTRSMFLMDSGGNIRWRQRIEGVIGDDTHIDDLVIAPILPGEERQILMATGPALLNKDGKILWALGSKYHHAQRVLAVPCGDGPSPCDVYFCESFRRAAYLLDHRGEEIWRFAGFQRPKAPYAEKTLMRLTTAGGLADWFGDGRAVIVQAELGSCGTENPQGMATFYATLLSREGEVITHLPFEDPITGAGAMCALPGRFASPDADGIAVIVHNSSRLYFFSRDET